MEWHCLIARIHQDQKGVAPHALPALIAFHNLVAKQTHSNAANVWGAPVVL
jgi:hypothetical protein